MKRLAIILMLLALVVVLFAGFGQDNERCRKTENLYISGLIHHTDEDEALLSVTLDNRSKIHDYDNILINAHFYDAAEVYLGGFTFSVKYEVNSGEKENYAVWIDEATPIERVEYEIVCAKYDE